MAKPIIIGRKGNEAVRSEIAEYSGYKVQEIETPKSDPLVNDAKGAELIIRRFEFALPPAISDNISDEELLEHHKGKIVSMLYKDGWTVAGKFQTLRQGNKFFILVPAKAGYKGGVKQTVLERPLTLQEITRPKK